MLPATTFLEREDLPVASLSLFTTPFVQFSEAVVAPRGEARQEWQIIEAIARRAGLVPFVPRRLGRALRRMPLVSPVRACSTSRCGWGRAATCSACGAA